MTDLTFTDHGSIVLLRADTDAGRDWIAEHINAQALTWAGQIVVEPRYVHSICIGAVEAGLDVDVLEGVR